MHKLSISAAWDETKAVLAHEGRLLVAVGLALFVLPGILVTTLAPSAATDEIPRAGPWLIAMFAILLISLAGQLAVIRLAMGPHLTVGEAISHGFKRLLPYLASVLIWMLPILLLAGVVYEMAIDGGAAVKGTAAIAALLLLLVVTFFSVRLLPGSAVASAEGVGPFGILKRAWSLSRGNWWRLFGFLVLFVIGAGILLWAVGAVAGLLAKILFGGIEPMSVGGLLAAIVSQLVSALVSIIFFVMLARIYVQLAGREGAHVSVPSSAD
jgi:hypothetical protein